MNSNKPLVFVDIETTGGSPKNSRVLELAAVRVENGTIAASMNSLIDSGDYIPPFIEHLTGISEAQVWGKPSFSGIVGEFSQLMQGAIFVAHNVNFDYSFIKNEYDRLGMQFQFQKICTVRLSRYFYPYEASHRLDAVIERHDIQVQDRHRAMGDAMAIYDFYRILLNEFDSTEIEAAIMQQLGAPIKKRILYK
ncbi:MAG: 3'-5' exonuclease [bacterium]